MTNTVTSVVEVATVIERNNCAGKKDFQIIPMGEDNIVRQSFRLNHGWLPPHAKLDLAKVADMDKVRIVLTNQFFPHMPQCVGEYIENLEEIYNRDATCRCGTLLVSDGYDIHCPSTFCALTLAARFTRLAETSFFEFETLNAHFEMIFNDDDFTQFIQPFKVINQGYFWGTPGGSLENILLRLTTGSSYLRNEIPSLATFLVAELFEEFLENPNIPNTLGSQAVKSIHSFYGEMNEMVNRRDPSSPTQNKLLGSFLWALGLESLRPESIYQMFVYENETALGDPMVIYAFLLTNPAELVQYIGLHPLEAAALVDEVRRRKEELHDIFRFYAINKQDITDTFYKLK